MIDLDFVCSENWKTYCLKQYNDYNFSDYNLVNNLSLTVTNQHDVVTEDFYANRYGYSKPANEKRVGGNLAVYRYPEDSTLSKQLKTILDLQAIDTTLQIQKPGNVVVEHVDRNRTFLAKLLTAEQRNTFDYKNIKRYIYFVEDQQLGQFFQVGNSPISWNAGDLIEFPYFAPHATANASLTDRLILAITGIK